MVHFTSFESVRNSFVFRNFKIVGVSTYKNVGFLTGFASVELAFLFHSVSFGFDPNKHEFHKHPLLKYLQL